MKSPILNQTSQRQKYRFVLVMYCFLVSISAFITTLIILWIPSDPQNNLLGLSLRRLMLLGSVFLPGILMAFFAIKAYRDEAWAKDVWSKFVGNEIILKRVIQITVIGFLAGWIISFMPLYVFADYKDYYFRLSPPIHWLTFVSSITLAIPLTEKYGLHWPLLTNLLPVQKKALSIAFVSLTIFILIWVLIARTGLGIRIVEDYWYGAGVPILGIQVGIAFALGMNMFLFEKSSIGSRFRIRSDLLIFVVIWIVAAFFWVREPLPDGFFAPGPYLPDYEFHPYSDASIFDLGSQFALIGQGINNGAPFDRVLYMGFLVLLHALVGQNYLDVIAWQTAVYAVFPGLLFLIGKAIHSRTFGIILAVLAISRGINGIAASNMIDLANQKQMLTDFPMLIFVVWISLLLVKWLKAPGKNYLYILWAGGAVGLAIMVRTHALFLLVFGILSILVVFRHQRSRGVLVSFLLILGVLASILPWEVQGGGNFLEIYKSRIQARYSPFLFPTTPTPQGNILPVFSFKSFEPALSVTAPSQPSLLITSPLISFSNASAGDLIVEQSGKDEAQDIPLHISMATNFFHNLVTSVFILPTSPVFHDLRHTVKEISPYWRQYWDGELGISSDIFLAINLLLISLGIGISWKSAGNSGLVPLGIFFFYNLANGVARTSGGRYIVPADWIVFLYFALGLLQVILWGRSVFGFNDDMIVHDSSSDHAGYTFWTWRPLKQSPWILIVFLLFGSLIPISEHLFPIRYSVQSQAELLAILGQKGYLKEMGLDKAGLSSISEKWPEFTIFKGRALYPRFFLEGKGLPKNQYPYGVLGYPRLGFTMIGRGGVNAVVLPQDRVTYFPNASDVIVIGCNNEGGVDALAVVVIDEQTVVYVRQPLSPLQCPLQQPVCDDNHVCR